MAIGEYKSLYDELMERLEGRIKVLTPEENYALITELNKAIQETDNHELNEPV